MKLIKLKLLLIVSAFTFMTLAKAQTCNPNIQKTKPDSQYELMNNGTEVLDKKTGLIWQRCVLGMSWNGATCAGTATNHKWEDALAEAATVASTTGVAWRLPNIKELRSLVEAACVGKAINETIFPVTPSYVWSSTTDSENTNNAWSNSFYSGKQLFSINKNNGLAVPLVRSQ
jgi:hypothetical protein